MLPPTGLVSPRSTYDLSVLVPALADHTRIVQLDSPHIIDQWVFFQGLVYVPILRNAPRKMGTRHLQRIHVQEM